MQHETSSKLSNQNSQDNLQKSNWMQDRNKYDINSKIKEKLVEISKAFQKLREEF